MDPTIRDNPSQSPADIPPRLGPYRVLHLLGRGGMGSVYMAVRDDDSFKRRVAIKVIRKGMDTADVLRRFELERQIVTALNHPNIARVFDAGQTEDGRPYVVMEYIEGLPLDVYCDRNRLSTADRVALFEKVCEAVHAAHQNLIVHRDLKPGNILVTPQGEPKLLDFGIAKILNPELAAITVVTGPEMRVMTPEYASPEQASGEPITTSSDVYSLGVLLYELLTGQMPYSFKTRVREEVLRVVREVDPEVPSTRVTKAQEFVDEAGTTRTITAADIAKARSEEPGRLRRQLQGDLDNIVLMAMHKSPAKRYRSAQALAEDLERHVNGFPVHARPDTFVYSMSRTIRRHKGAVVAAAAVVVVAIAGAAATAWQVRNARDARRDAEQQAALASEQTRRLEQVRAFASDFLEKLQGAIARAEGSLKTREVLADTSIKVLDYLGGEFPDDPTLRFLRAQAWRRVGDIQGGRGGSRGNALGASECYARAWTLLEGSEGGVTVDDLRDARAGVLLELATTERETGNRAEARATLDRAFLVLGDQPESGRARYLLAQLLLTRAKWADSGGADGAHSAADLDRSLAMRRELLASDPGNKEYLRAVGVALTEMGASATDTSEALPFFEENLTLRRQAAAHQDATLTDKRDVITAVKSWGDALVDLGRAGDVIQPLSDALAELKSLSCASPEDPRLRRDMVFFQESIARAHESLGDYTAAEAHYRAFATEAAALAAADQSNTRLGEIAAGAADALEAFLRDRVSRQR